MPFWTNGICALEILDAKGIQYDPMGFASSKIGAVQIEDELTFLYKVR